jgi:predicted DNA-binding transcriptional regulator YafY
MALAAEEALVKIEAVVPEAERERIARTEIHAPAMNMTDEQRGLLDAMQQATDERRVYVIDYRDAEEAPSERRVRPLGLWFWGKVWTLVAWCELRQDFRMFRIDRIVRAIDSGDRFRPQAGRLLADFYAQMSRRDDRHG